MERRGIDVFLGGKNQWPFLARRYGILEHTLYRRREECIAAGEAALMGAKSAADPHNLQIEKLKRELAQRDQVNGELTIAKGLLKKC